MIERVAAAMWERTHDGRWDDWGDGQDESRIIHREDARAAIEILRKDARTIDRDELVALLENLASVNLSREACERQAQRMADGLIAALDRDWGKSND